MDMDRTEKEREGEMNLEMEYVALGEKMQEGKSLISIWRGMATLAEDTAHEIGGDTLEDLTKAALLQQKVSDLRLCASCLEIILDEPETTG
jgi:hypothetical protein